MWTEWLQTLAPRNAVWCWGVGLGWRLCCCCCCCCQGQLVNSNNPRIWTSRILHQLQPKKTVLTVEGAKSQSPNTKFCSPMNSYNPIVRGFLTLLLPQFASKISQYFSFYLVVRFWRPWKRPRYRSVPLWQLGNRQCAVCSVQFSVCSMQCAVLSLQCTVCIVRCAFCIMKCVVCCVHYAVCSVQSALCIVQSSAVQSSF